MPAATTNPIAATIAKIIGKIGANALHIEAPNVPAAFAAPYSAAVIPVNNWITAGKNA